MVGQAAFHNVQTVVPAGLDGRHALAEGAVEHLGQRTHTRRRVAHLQQGVGRKERVSGKSALCSTLVQGVNV